MQPNNMDPIIMNNILQHGFIVNNNLIGIEPVLQGHVYDGHGATGPLILIGFLAGEPVYRTTHTVAHHMEGNWPGAYRIHWPPLFPNLWLPECDYLQLDVTIRKAFSPQVPPVEGGDDNDDDDDENDSGQQMIFYNNIKINNISIYDDNEDISVPDDHQQQQIQQSYDNINNIHEEWVHINNIHEEWVDDMNIDQEWVGVLINILDNE